MAILAASNDVTDWSGHSGVDASGTFHAATRVPYAIKFVRSATCVFRGPHAAPASTTVWYHFNLRPIFSYGNAEDGLLVSMYDVNGKLVASVRAADGRPAARANGDTMVEGAPAASVISAALISYDLKVEVTPSTITTEVYIAGTLASTASAANTSGGKGVPRFFTFDGDDGMDMYFSEWIAADTDTRGMMLHRIKPNGVGNYSAWTGGHTLLSDEDIGTAATSDTAAQRVSSTIAAYAGGDAVAAVVATIRASIGGSGPTGIKQFLRIGAADYDGGLHSPDQPPDQFIQQWDVDPSDSEAWTQAKVNACQLGLLSVT